MPKWTSLSGTETRRSSTPWYDKRYPTFSDALALMRKQLWVWEEQTSCGSAQENEMVKVSQA